MLEKFKHYLEIEKRHSKHTVSAYITDLNQFISYAHLESFKALTEVSHFQVREWIVGLIDESNCNKSVNRKIATLRSFFKWCRNEKIITNNPMQKVKALKVEKRLPVFAKESELELNRMEQFFEPTFAGRRDQLIFEIFYQTGIRLSELIGLKENDCTSNSVKVLGKRNKERIIPISPFLSEKLTAYKSEKVMLGFDSPYLLVLDNGKKLYSTFVYRKINYYLSKATNMDRNSPHVLRHTFATHMLNRGSGLETLKDLLGHANLSATQIYTHNSFAQLTTIYSQAHPRGQK